MTTKITDILQHQLDSPANTDDNIDYQEVININNSAMTNEQSKPSHLWKPGQSGNPSGRPAMPVSIVKKLRSRLILQPELADQIVDSLLQLGIKSDLGAIKEVIDRIDGKVVETHRIEGEIPVILKFTPARELIGDGSNE